jgi:hypothetical protein
MSEIVEPYIENLYLKKNINGGGLSHIKFMFININNVNYNYLIGETSKNVYIFENNPKTINLQQDISSKLKRKVDDDIEFNTNDNVVITSNNFLSHGSSNIVYRIKNIKTDEKFLLKITCDYQDDNHNLEFKNKYLEDRNKYKHYIPEIYAFGNIINEENPINIIIHYHIVKEYYIDFDVLTLHDRFIYLMELTKLLKNIQNSKAYVRDLKIQNVGFDDDYHPILIDYDKTTIEYYELSQKFEGHTFYPCYAVEDHLFNKKKY